MMMENIAVDNTSGEIMGRKVTYRLYSSRGSHLWGKSRRGQSGEKTVRLYRYGVHDGVQNDNATVVLSTSAYDVAMDLRGDLNRALNGYLYVGNKVFCTPQSLLDDLISCLSMFFEPGYLSMGARQQIIVGDVVFARIRDLLDGRGLEHHDLVLGFLYNRLVKTDGDTLIGDTPINVEDDAPGADTPGDDTPGADTEINIYEDEDQDDC